MDVEYRMLSSNLLNVSDIVVKTHRMINSTFLNISDSAVVVETDQLFSSTCYMNLLGCFYEDGIKSNATG